MTTPTITEIRRNGNPFASASSSPATRSQPGSASSTGSGSTALSAFTDVPPPGRGRAYLGRARAQARRLRRGQSADRRLPAAGLDVPMALLAAHRHPQRDQGKCDTMILKVHLQDAPCYEIGDEIWQQPLADAIAPKPRPSPPAREPTCSSPTSESGRPARPDHRRHDRSARATETIHGADGVLYSLTDGPRLTRPGEVRSPTTLSRASRSSSKSCGSRTFHSDRSAHAARWSAGATAPRARPSRTRMRFCVRRRSWELRAYVASVEKSPHEAILGSGLGYII